MTAAERSKFVAWMLLCLAACRLHAQAGPPPEPKKPAPTFHAAGVQGNIAPSGYSAGAKDEETRQVSGLVASLQAANFAGDLATGPLVSCDRRSGLLHAALTQPGSFAANLDLGLFYLQHNDPSLSVKYLGLAAGIRPADPVAVRALATAALETKDYAAAARLARQLIDADKADPAAHRIEGSAEAAMGDSTAALAEFKLAVSLDPGVNSALAAGFSLMTAGSYIEAERMLAAGTEAHPDSAKLWLARGMAEILSSHSDGAIESLLRATALDPADLLAPTLLAPQAGGTAGPAGADARILAAEASLAAARPKEAVAHYDYALALSKISPRADGAREDSRLETELKTAIAEQPGLAAAHFLLGAYYQDRGDAPSAVVAELSEAVRLSPDVPAWHYRLARAYRKAGNLLSAELEMRSFQRLKNAGDAAGAPFAKLLNALPPDVFGFKDSSCP